MKRNRKIHRGLVFALVLLLAWTNAAATDWTVTTDSASDHEEGTVPDAPSIEHSLDGADSEGVSAGSECPLPPSSNRRPELPLAAPNCRRSIWATASLRTFLP